MLTFAFHVDVCKAECTCKEIRDITAPPPTQVYEPAVNRGVGLQMNKCTSASAFCLTIFKCRQPSSETELSDYRSAYQAVVLSDQVEYDVNFHRFLLGA